MSYALLFFRESVGEDIYTKSRNDLIEELEENIRLLDRLDPAIFRDRELARAVLKYPYAMEALKEYQDDDEMVRYALECNGRSIEYVDKRFLDDRELVRLAIEHSGGKSIMHLDCMERYRDDKEFAYLACKVHPWNFTEVSEELRDDYDLAYMVMSSDNYKQSVSEYLSDRLKDDVSLAVLETETECSLLRISNYSERVRDSEELAEAIIKHYGINSLEMYDMSDRIKEKYGFDENA